MVLIFFGQEGVGLRTRVLILKNECTISQKYSKWDVSRINVWAVISKTMVSWCKFVVLTTHFRPCRVRFCHFQSPSKIGCPKFWPHGCQNLSKWVKSSIFHTIGAEVIIFVPTTPFSTPMCSIIVRTIVSTTSFLPSKATFLVFSNTFKNVFTQILTPGVLKLLKMEKSLNECV